MEIDGVPEGHRHAHHHRRPHGHSLTSAIVSGDSEQDDGESSSSSEDMGGSGEDEDIFENVGGAYSVRGTEAAEEALFRNNSSNPAHADELYDDNLDDEDEAYVYRNMRGGLQETVMVRQEENAESSPTQLSVQENATARPMKMLKPRGSDAVLSCPCCFNIVCMDCQRHQRYLNQFRAMFVMGITVDWQSRLIYDEDQRILVPKPQQSHPNNQIPLDTGHELNDIGEIVHEDRLQYKEGEYFPVLCGNCRTQVAALDMIEEVYHFHGCLESS